MFKFSRRWLLVVALTATTLILLVVAAWTYRAPLLRSAANAWLVSDPLEPAEATVVLGGSVNIRPFVAAKLYRDGLVSRVVLMNVRTTPTEKLGLTPTHTDLNRDVLLKLGVPANALTFIGNDISSTFEEALTVRDWIQSSGVKTLILPTEFIHTRRVRWLFNKVLKDTGARISVQAVDPIDYNRLDWWQHEEGVVGFHNELLKYLYYRLKY